MLNVNCRFDLWSTGNSTENCTLGVSMVFIRVRNRNWILRSCSTNVIRMTNKLSRSRKVVQIQNHVLLTRLYRASSSYEQNIAVIYDHSPPYLISIIALPIFISFLVSWRKNASRRIIGVYQWPNRGHSSLVRPLLLSPRALSPRLYLGCRSQTGGHCPSCRWWSMAGQLHFLFEGIINYVAIILR